jgi:MerR family transcriptional regulator/heat shock protein HspR
MAKSTQACYVISVAAKLVSIHPQTLRYYERLGLVQPSRSDGRIRLYSDEDIERLQQIRRLTEDLGVNLAGVEVILNLTEKIRDMERELLTLRTELAQLRQQERAKGQGKR